MPLEKHILDLCRDPEYIKFLEQLMYERLLKNPALGIARMVADGRASELSEKQANVFTWYVYRPYKDKNRCVSCRAIIPYDELVNAVCDWQGLCWKCFERMVKRAQMYFKPKEE